MPLNKLVNSGSLISPPPDVQRTTFSLDVLGRFVCSTWDEAAHNGGAPFDAVVIGSGMFGGYCADKIFRFGTASKLRVLVLEAGPFLVPTHVQNLPRASLNVPGPEYPSDDPGTARELVWGMPWRSNVQCVGQPYCFGGKSLYWGGWCPRLLSDDMAHWPASVAAYLNDNYPRLEEQTGVSVTTDFIQGPLYGVLKTRIAQAISAHEVANLDVVEDPPLAVQGQAPASGLFSFDKFSSATLLIDAVREAASEPDAQRRLFVIPNAHVTRIAVEGGTATEIQVSVDGIEQRLPLTSQCSVVLALGTIESTRLALWSFPSVPAAADEKIGRNLLSHIRSNIFVRVRRTALDTANVLPVMLQTGAVLVRGSTPAGKFHIQVTASADASFNSDAELFSMVPDVDQLDMLLQSQESGWISIAFRGVSEMQGDKTSSVPNAAGRWINLSPFELDEFGIPRAYVQFTTTPSEDALANDMDSAILALALKLADGNVADLVVMSQNRDPLGTTYHEGGTLWMGDDPNLSVTDTDGRFHHLSNVFCSDQSLFVTSGSVNPTLTGLTLSRKVAEAVVARATGAPSPL
jgi:choline dehydrogenase-like flavoprotein